MERKNLQSHVRTLITLPVTDAPIISCYQTLTAGRLADRNAFDERVRSLRQGLTCPGETRLRHRPYSYRGHVGNRVVAQFQGARRLLASW